VQDFSVLEHVIGCVSCVLHDAQPQRLSPQATAHGDIPMFQQCCDDNNIKPSFHDLLDILLVRDGGGS
jgi:hypothetical protein